MAKEHSIGWPLFAPNRIFYEATRQFLVLILTLSYHGFKLRHGGAKLGFNFLWRDLFICCFLIGIWQDVSNIKTSPNIFQIEVII